MAGVLKIWDGSQWVVIAGAAEDGADGASVTVSASAPGSASAGDFWLDSDASSNGILYIRNAGNTAWVQIAGAADDASAIIANEVFS